MDGDFLDAAKKREKAQKKRGDLFTFERGGSKQRFDCLRRNVDVNTTSKQTKHIMASKPSRTGTGPPKPVEESADGVPKPLAATLMAEFQNLKDKFKNEDDVQEKGRCHQAVTRLRLRLRLRFAPVATAACGGSRVTNGVPLFSLDAELTLFPLLVLLHCFYLRYRISLPTFGEGDSSARMPCVSRRERRDAKPAQVLFNDHQALIPPGQG